MAFIGKCRPFRTFEATTGSLSKPGKKVKEGIRNP